jgi:hypothetical protein
MEETESTTNEAGEAVNEPASSAGEPAIEVSTPAKRRKRIFWISGGVLLVVLLSAAAFVGGRLLNDRPVAGGGPMVMSNGAGGSAVKMEFSAERPEELPDTPPSANGLLVKREDNVLTVQTGSGNIVAAQGPDGVPHIKTENAGPEIEVVINRDTKIYRDSTFDDQSKMPEDGGTLQMTVEEASVEDIGENTFLTAWGRKSGDRIIADVIFFSSPAMIRKR